MRKRFFMRWILVLMCTYSASISFAQNKTVSGVITDESSTPLSQATVKVKDGKISTVTNASGYFKITIPETTKFLTVSYVGLLTQDVAVSNQTEVAIKLAANNSALNEVVVIGYGSTRRANVTSAISSVSEKDIKGLIVSGVDQALQGKVAGVSVTNNSGQPGGGVSLRVRGITSINGNEPLYVIDGVPILSGTSSIPQDQLGGQAGQSSQSVLATMNPADIASIDILKDASAQAIYGSRGGNGVVLITTKKGKSGEGKLNYDVYYGWQSIRKKLDVLNLKTYAQYYNSLVPEIRAAGGGLDTIGEFANPGVLGKGTNWQNEIFQTGNIQNHQLSFSGGQNKTTYYFSGNYFDQIGTVIGSKFKRYAMRASIAQEVKPWLRAGININASRTNQKITFTDGTDAVTNIVLFNSPATPVRDPYGQYIGTTSVGGTQFGSGNNPIAKANLRNVTAQQTKAFGNIYAEVQFTKFLTLRNEFNYDFQLNENNAFQPLISNDSTRQVISSPSRLREDRNNYYFYSLSNYLTFNNNFGKHYINAVVGHEAQYSHYDNASVTVTNLNLNIQSLAAGTVDIGSTGGGKGTYGMESYFGRVTYSYDNKYSISGSTRRDASSNFGPDKKVGFFSAGSLGWTITNEEFAKNLKPLNYLKLRLGVGAIGNQNAPSQGLYETNIRLFAVAPFGPGGINANIGYPALSWESIITYNGGIDASILNKKIDLTVDVYKKVTENMILPTVLPVFAGLDPNPPNNAYNNIEPPVTNGGQMTNTGIDVGITSYNVQKKNFTWRTNLVFSHYKNLLNRLNSVNAVFPGNANDFTGNSSVVNYTRPGHAVGTFYGFVTDGLFRTQAELSKAVIPRGLVTGYQGIYLGDIRYKDLNGNGVIDDQDVTYIGDPNPKFTYGLTNTFTFKSFDFSFFFTGVYGSQIFNWTRKYTEALNSPYTNQLSTVNDRYTASNTNGTLPRFNQWNNNNTINSDRYVESGSYLRLQNVSLGYNLPKRIINKAKITTARIYATAQNIFTITQYSGYDPEIGSYNKNALSQNVDNGHYPNPRSITIGANLEF